MGTEWRSQYSREKNLVGSNMIDRVGDVNRQTKEKK